MTQTDTDSFRLDDAERRHRLHPKTFNIPSSAIRRDLLAPNRRGDVAMAKLIFLPSDGRGGERLWVRVERQTGNGYVGTVANEVMDGRLGLRCGDAVRFEPRHVVDVDVVRGDKPKPSVLERVKSFLTNW